MLLTWIVFLPLLLACLIAVAPEHRIVKIFAIVGAVVEFGLSVLMLSRFDVATSNLQFVERANWIPQFGVTYFLGVDGISLWLVILTTFLTPLVLLGAWKSIEKSTKGFLVSIFVLETAMLGTFLALDAILFYLFWELSLVPMYFLIGIWGGARRIYATVKFFIYTMLGSVLMLLAIITMMLFTQDVNGTMSASLLDFYNLSIPFVAGQFFSPQTLLFFAFALAFAIKVPMFPFHTWLPDAHVEAPTPGSVILAGVMLKMGTYGFIRWVIPMFHEASIHFAWLFMLLAVIGIVYGALVAMVQPDMKKLVAYSSVSHMGYVVLGLFSLNSMGATGALYQMLNHGISTGALFFLVGMIYERTHSREISRYGGLASVLPYFTIAFFIFTLSSIAVPLTNGFVGEFLILIGAFKADRGFSSVAALGVVLGAVYMLWMFKKIFFGKKGELVQDEKHPLHDLDFREVCVLAPLLVLVFWMGICPSNFLSYSKVSLDHLIQNQANYQLSDGSRPQPPVSAPTSVPEKEDSAAVQPNEGEEQ